MNHARPPSMSGCFAPVPRIAFTSAYIPTAFQAPSLGSRRATSAKCLVGLVVEGEDQPAVGLEHRRHGFPEGDAVRAVRQLALPGRLVGARAGKEDRSSPSRAVRYSSVVGARGGATGVSSAATWSGL